MKNLIIFVGGVALGAYFMENHIYRKISKIYVEALEEKVEEKTETEEG